jgi:hypothetical protein
MYGNFAGRDASRGMAKQSFSEGACLSYLHPQIHGTTEANEFIEMLTDIDKPLDKLEDLTNEEMYVLFPFRRVLSLTGRVFVYSENMKGMSF